MRNWCLVDFDMHVLTSEMGWSRSKTCVTRVAATFYNRLDTAEFMNIIRSLEGTNGTVEMFLALLPQEPAIKGALLSQQITYHASTSPLHVLLY
jgi:hypothetical protein